MLVYDLRRWDEASQRRAGHPGHRSVMRLEHFYLCWSGRALGVLPSPLWGGVGGGGPSADHRTTPTPAQRRQACAACASLPACADPPHKGEGRTEFAARTDSPPSRAMTTKKPPIQPKIITLEAHRRAPLA